MVRFSVSSLSRFLSHHEMLRVFERTLRRMALPMKYSEGFNPRARISLPLPRSVGMFADDELLCFEVETGGSFDFAEFEKELQKQLPCGIDVKGVSLQSRNTRPRAVAMELVFDLDGIDEAFLRQGFARLEQAAGGERLELTRTYGPKKPAKNVDIGQYICSVEKRSDELRVGCEITGGGTVRPCEILKVLGSQDQAMEAKVRRMAVKWINKDGSEPAFMN
jgi:radical SAM-linked protein